jgi:UDP-glucose 4-epimerase
MNYDLVWGGAGFIGSHLVDELIKLRRKVIVVDNLCRSDISNINKKADFFEIDITDDKAISILKKYKIDTLYNLATVGLLESLEKPEECVNQELKIASQSCKFIRENNCKRLVYFSSSEVYGNQNKTISDIYDAKNPTTPYAIGKLAGQLLVENYIKLFDINAYIIIPFNNYGPRQTLQNYQGIIPLAIKNMLNNEPIPINGTGEQIRDYIYVKDTIKWLLRAVYFYPMEKRIFNISANNPITVLELIDKISKLGDFMPKIKFRDKRLGDEELLTCDIDPLIELTNFDEGLKETIKWYREYYGKN